jgi:DMSO/TMAO reductase YedYZ molybdopterin-dependent catalytic subunit
VNAFVPLPLFDAILGLLGPIAKQLLFSGVAAGVVLAGGLLALTSLGRPTRSALLHALLLAFFGLAIVELVVLPLTGDSLLAGGLAGDPVAFHGPIAAAALLYGAVLAGQLGVARPPLLPASATDSVEPGATRPRFGRRSFLARAMRFAGGGSLVVSALALGSQVVSAATSRRPRGEVAFPPGGFGPTPALTPVADFYQVNKNALSTVVDAANWRLRVDGLVARPHDYTLDELRALPAETGNRTLECISFDILRGDDLIGNQEWRGTRVAGLLDEAGVDAGARFILWEAEDGYTESIPIEVARDDQSWIAYEMAGQPLTPEHGFPARVLIAGRFGMKQPKWVNRLTVSDHDIDGYWEQRGWDREAVVMTMSRIDDPAPGDSVPVGVPFKVYGIANSGDRGIATVELSPDGGTKWLEAELEDASRPPLGPLTWVRWRAEVTLPVAGTARLVVRAIDGEGGVQDGTERPSLPSGATGWHAIRVVAVEGQEG